MHTAEEHQKAGWFSLFSAFGCLMIIDSTAAIGLIFNSLNFGLDLLRIGFISDELKLKFGNFESSYLLYKSLGLPFILRHYPFITLQPTSNLRNLIAPQSGSQSTILFWFSRERGPTIPLQNNSANEVKSLRFRRFGSGEQSITYPYQAKGNKYFRVSLYQTHPSSSHLDPTFQTSLSLSLRRHSDYPRYPYINLPDLSFNCRYSGKEFHLSLGDVRIQRVPSRSAILNIIQTESPKVNYDPTETARALQRVLRERYGLKHISEPTSTHLYRQLVPSRFEAWIKQFDPKDQHLIYKPYRALRFYSSDEIQEKFRLLFRSKLPNTIVRHALFIGMGKHLGKSGFHLLYFVKHIYRELFLSVDSDEVELRFQHPAALLTNPRYQDEYQKLKINAIVFIDDFFGTGGQAIADFNKFSKDYPELWSYSKYYITITGFTRGKEEIIRSFPELSDKILTADQLLDDSYRAFTFPSRIFTAKIEMIQAERICRTIGHAIIGNIFKRTKDPDKRKKYDLGHYDLGWDNDQALIAFEHNIPNNTLPIFWATGNYKGKRWQPLYERKE